MKKVISTLITLAMLIATIPMTASALVVDDWEIEISNGEAYIIGFNGKCPDKITLPTQIGNFTVVGLKSNIFTENVTEIIIPEGYKTISMKMSVVGDYLGATKDKLEKITLPSTLETMDFNFKNCTNLKEIKIPRGVKKLQDSMFEGCLSLKYVYSRVLATKKIVIVIEISITKASINLIVPLSQLFIFSPNQGILH